MVFNEVFDGTVVCPFFRCREKAGGKLAVLPVIVEAFAADALPAVGFIRTITHIFIPGNITLRHNNSLVGTLS